MFPCKRIFTWAGAIAAMVLPAMSQAQTTTAADWSGGGDRWVATWSSAPIAPGPTTIDAIFGGDRSRSFENQTVRHVVHTSVGGQRLRVRISNEYGQLPLRVGAAQVALSSAQAAVYPGTGRRLTFGGQGSVLVPAGGLMVSDALDIGVPADGNLAVSLYLPGVTEPATFHEFTLQTSYVTAANSGNLVSAPDLPGAAATPSTFYLTAVDVLPSESIGSLVAFGDSIAQGGGSSPDKNHTWPDKLSDRLNPNPYRPRLSVVNQGVGCGRLLYDLCGPNGIARFDRDVLAVSGVRTVIVSLGLNDIMIPSTLPNFGKPEFADEAVSATDIINGLKQLVLRAHARDVRVIGATITPFGSSTVPGVFTPETEAKRQAVNRWIRTGGGFDGVIDFEAAVRDPANLSRLLPIYDADGVHLSDAGYQAMANAINLAILF
jgi:lysophospholipase L1-like esterase